jgi:sugar O-acyltransferase (sialic acid O-acetyltransferase NeuD family)
MKQLIIIGAGGFGREVLAWARQSAGCGTEWTIKGFIDDNPDAIAGLRVAAPWIGRIEDHQPAADEVFICAIGIPALRRKCYERIEARGGRFVSLVHRTAVVGDEVEFGDGVILCPCAVVSGYNKIGKGVVVNMHATIDHDANVGDWTQVNCHCDITGGVQVGSEVWFGSHVAVAPRVRIGDRAYLGIGSAILRDVDADTKVFGLPARRVE